MEIRIKGSMDYVVCIIDHGSDSLSAEVRLIKGKDVVATTTVNKKELKRAVSSL